jgi:hypothetical protein
VPPEAISDACQTTMLHGLGSKELGTAGEGQTMDFSCYQLLKEAR